jgi:nitroreductase
VITGLFDHNKVNDILHVPKGYDAVTLIPLGYPAKDAPAPKRRDIGEFTHKDSF